MGIVALIVGLATAGAGLYLLAIWLIEYDRDFQTSAATRLPIPVISSHALLALTALVMWAAYLLLDSDELAWVTLGLLACVAVLGLTMAYRWLGVYRSTTAAAAASAAQGTPMLGSYGAAPGAPGLAAYGSVASGTRPQLPGTRPGSQLGVIMPPERHFPVSVVIIHGVFAVTTVVIVLLTTLNVMGGS
jgi:hypothetical protein